MVRIPLIAAGLFAGVLALAACSEGRPMPPDVAFSATAEAVEPVTAFGQAATWRFTIVNDGDVPMLVERIDALIPQRTLLADFLAAEERRVRQEGDRLVADPEGAKRRFAAARSLVPVGGRLTFTAKFRAIVDQTTLAITSLPLAGEDFGPPIWIREPGSEDRFVRADPARAAAFSPGEDLVLLPFGQPRPRQRFAHAPVRFDVPPPPFRRPARDDPFTWSSVLSGYVFRPGPLEVLLFRKDGMAPLPPAPLEFFDELDGGGTALIELSGERIEVTAENAEELLREIRTNRRRIEWSPDPERAPYQVVE